jgi:hypothetical protein
MPRRYIDRRAEAEIEAMLARGELAQAKKAEQPSDQQHTLGKARSGGHTAGDWQGIVEQRIQDGMERGLFDNLRGMGKPLNLDEDQFVPDELKMAFRLLRSTGLAPLWVEMNKEIREDIARLDRLRDYAYHHTQTNPIERDHVRHQYLARVMEINSKILSYNIIAPSSHVHLGLLIVEEELAKFDQYQP